MIFTVLVVSPSMPWFSRLFWLVMYPTPYPLPATCRSYTLTSGALGYQLWIAKRYHLQLTYSSLRQDDPLRVKKRVKWHVIASLPICTLCRPEELHAPEIGAIHGRSSKGPTILMRICGFLQREHDS